MGKKKKINASVDYLRDTDMLILKLSHCRFRFYTVGTHFVHAIRQIYNNIIIAANIIIYTAEVS